MERQERISSRLRLALGLTRTWLLYGWRLRSLGARSVIERPYRLIGARYMTIGDGVRIMAGARLEAFRQSSTAAPPRLIIERDVAIGQRAHIVATQQMVIGRGCLIAANVTIVDASHLIDPPQSPGLGRRLRHRL